MINTTIIEFVKSQLDRIHLLAIYPANFVEVKDKN
jgi:hypothetical protein